MDTACVVSIWKVLPPSLSVALSLPSWYRDRRTLSDAAEHLMGKRPQQLFVLPIFNVLATVCLSEDDEFERHARAFWGPSALHFLPRIAKYIAFILLAVNARSLPFGWHFRVFYPALQLRAQLWLFRLSLIFHSRKQRRAALIKWVENLSPIGANPMDKMIVYKTWAALDDCDYNFHLSNSCYPKTLDSARLQAALSFFPAFLREGGWIALGGTHFNFMREIRILSPYEVRMNIASWDNKWFFLVVRFVTKPTQKSGTAKPAPSPAPISDKPAQATAQTPMDTPFPSLHTPASGTSTPLPRNVPASSPEAAAAMASVAAQLRGATEPDGAVVNCISVNECVFKHGRITVPPALVLAADGLCAEPGYSAAKPPPHWAEVHRLREAGAMRAFLRGGWRDVPEGERWWEQALAGLEQRRAANYALIRGVRDGLDGARGIVG
ncbi:hypothetical protein BV25DRAFT_1900560 [Artomyces pyxidatus]|uniref:Uncharacterized protein n=1 Tax=Artomyces pyxidatus TaxID=48021 RepID=A0ACB8SZP7_9AGAM|nr:hypothetical protein BV25DRAFT_1900560 [Artomyces pyxidatus]